MYAVDYRYIDLPVLYGAGRLEIILGVSTASPRHLSYTTNAGVIYHIFRVVGYVYGYLNITGGPMKQYSGLDDIVQVS